MPSKLFETHYTTRKVHLYHVLDDELCVWRPSEEDVAQQDHGIEVTLISGHANWMGKKNHSYGHLVFSSLTPGEFSIDKILNVPGVVPLYEKQKAPFALNVMVHIACQTPPNTFFKHLALAVENPLPLMNYLCPLRIQVSHRSTQRWL